MADTFKVTAPAAGFSGVVAGVAFQHGEATVTSDQTAALAYFRRRGYTVEPVEVSAPDAEAPVEPAGDGPDDPQPDPKPEKKQAAAKRGRRAKEDDDQ